MTANEFLATLDNLGIRARKGGIPSEEARRDLVAWLFPLDPDQGTDFGIPAAARPTTYWKWHADKLRDLLAKHGVAAVPGDLRAVTIREKKRVKAVEQLSFCGEASGLFGTDPQFAEGTPLRNTVMAFFDIAKKALAMAKRGAGAERGFRGQEMVMDMDHAYARAKRAIYEAPVETKEMRRVIALMRKVGRGGALYGSVLGIYGEWYMKH
jgi:hypothetical protein